ncbi:hypothetical protein [Streptomyces sp. 4N124]|uniref:hypothetical protein n=1 Tax=Streptomyces sp. 4N124 TaxID=3457420 RepID=UPI003FD43B69
MTGIGPVEPVDSPGSEESCPTIGSDRTRRAEHWSARWARLSPKTRKAALGAAAIALVAAGILVPPALTPEDRAEPQDTPVPWPANVTTWRYLGLATPHKPGATSGRFLFAVTVDHGPPVSLEVSGTAFDGLTAHAVPWPSFLVPGGTTLRIAVEVSVSDCSGVPLNADLPFLDVTLRNTRAIQHHSFIFGGAYSHDLSRLLQGACAPIPAAPPARPTGSASSQNVD